MKYNANKDIFQYLKIIKEKFELFKEKVELQDLTAKHKACLIQFQERFVTTKFISNCQDPYRNNLATRNPQNLNEIQQLLANDFQYLRLNFIKTSNLTKLPNIPPMKFPGNNFPSRPINLHNRPNPQKTLAPRHQVRNAQND